MRSATPSVVVTTTRVQGNLEGLADSAERPIHWLLLDAFDADASAWRPTEVDEDSLAFLQYTSRSTGDPKGVMVSHRNLLHNLAAIQRCFKTHREQTGLIWLRGLASFRSVRGPDELSVLMMSSASSGVMLPSLLTSKGFVALR